MENVTSWMSTGLSAEKIDHSDISLVFELTF